jgi:ribonucleoside-diphosphate reductase alpha chain
MEKNLTTMKENIMSDTQFQDTFSQEIWASTYKDHNDFTIDDSFRRVAKTIASGELPEKQQEWEEKFYDMLTNFKGVAGGRILSNAGTEWKKTSFLNCFVGALPDSDLDSINSIFQVLTNQANTLKSEGGWGMDFSWIRPRGAFIGGVGVESPGAVKFMELFDKSSEIVTSGSGKKSINKKAKGKIRKGAMMATLSVSHPDIVEFITAKQTQGRLSKFNMSVDCTDAFMALVLDGGDHDWHLEFPDTTFAQYKSEWRGNLAEWKSKGYPVNLYDSVKVQWLWNLIMESTYNRAEPGVMFLDRANAFNPLSYGEKILSTNPCGEQVLAPGGVCCLGTINLTQFVKADLTGFDLVALKKYVGYMVRFLDNVNTVSDAPLPEYKYSMVHKRRIGAGVMGWGSALLMLQVKFGSEKAETLRTEVMSTYARAAYEASIDLAGEKGMFSLCDPVKHAEGQFVQSLGLSEEYMLKLRTSGIRNSSLLSEQPNGNSSILANIVSGGIEPVFMPEYTRTVIVSVVPENIKSVTPKYWEGEFKETELFKFAKEGDEDILKGVADDGIIYKIDKNRGLTKEVLCEDYGVRFLKQKGLWDKSAPWAATTTELSVQDHVNDLKGFARWVDSACSKTANIPNSYPFDDFKTLYTDVYKTGYIKGFTTYRSGTMTSVLSAKEEVLSEPEEIILENVKLPDSLPATLKTLRAEGRKWYLTVIENTERTRPVALFVQTNAHEKSIIANTAVENLLLLAREKGIPEEHIVSVEEKISGDSNPSKICRCVSLCLRHGVGIKSIVARLDKTDCLVGTFVFHIRKYLASLIKDGDKVPDEKCLECGSENVVYQEGCKVCVNCGSSKCG